MSRTVKLWPYVAEKVARKHSDFKLTYFCTGGPGGQAQNKRKTGVRITDKITGLSSESRDATGQDDNKKRAFNKLVDMLIQHYKDEMMKDVIEKTEPEKSIRTYRLIDNKVVDRRLPGKEFKATEILNGRLETLVEQIMLKELKNEDI